MSNRFWLLCILTGQIISASVWGADIPQIIHNGGIGVVNTGLGSVNITGYTIEQHEEKVREELTTLRELLEKIYREETRALTSEKEVLALQKTQLEYQVAERENDLVNLNKSYQDRISLLEEQYQAISNLQDLPKQILAEAQEALSRSDTSKADALFQQVIEDKVGTRYIEQRAAAHYERGRIAYYELRFREAFEHIKRTTQLTPDNSSYLETAGNFALTLGEYNKAIGYYEHALSTDLKTFGEDNSRTAKDHYNLGAAWELLGELEKAIGYFELALSSNLNAYGEDHQIVAQVRMNLARVWATLGDSEKSMGYFEQAMTSIQKIPGGDSTLIMEHNRGYALSLIGENEKAVRYFERALSSSLNIYGEDDYFVSVERHYLGNAWLLLGEYEKAIEYFELALSSNLKTFGEDHPNVAEDRHYLGNAWLLLGEYEKATEYFELALAIVEKVYGADHLFTKLIRYDLGNVGENAR